jgi:hypothetical protein
MKKIVTIWLFALILISIYQFVECKTYREKALPKFEEVDKETGVYIIRYSNVVFDINNKKIKVPIYNGIYEDITYEDLEKQQTKKDLYLLGNIYIPVKDGEVKKTFFDILNFYKKSLFRDIDTNKPSVIGNEGGEDMYIWYDFDYEGIPCSMMITVACDVRATSKKMRKMNPNNEDIETVDMLVFKEDSKWIGLTIIIGEYSKFKKVDR